MKKSTFITFIATVAITLASVVSCESPKQAPSSDTAENEARNNGGIVFVRIDTLILQYDMFSDKQSEFEAKAQTVQDDLNKKGRKLESDIKAFENQIQKGLLTRSAAEQQQTELQKRQQELQELAAQKQYDLQEEEMVLNNQVMDAIKTYLEKYNESHNYAAILTTSSATNTVIVGSSELDITQEVIEGLNSEYAKTRNNKAE